MSIAIPSLIPLTSSSPIYCQAFLTNGQSCAQEFGGDTHVASDLVTLLGITLEAKIVSSKHLLLIKSFNIHISNDTGSGRLYLLHPMLHCTHTLLNIYYIARIHYLTYITYTVSPLHLPQVHLKISSCS